MTRRRTRATRRAARGLVARRRVRGEQAADAARPRHRRYASAADADHRRHGAGAAARRERRERRDREPALRRRPDLRRSRDRDHRRDRRPRGARFVVRRDAVESAGSHRVRPAQAPIAVQPEPRRRRGERRRRRASRSRTTPSTARWSRRRSPVYFRACVWIEGGRRHGRRQRVPRRLLRRAGALHHLADDAVEQRVPRRRRAGHRQRTCPARSRSPATCSIRTRRSTRPSTAGRIRSRSATRARHRGRDAEAAEPERRPRFRRARCTATPSPTTCSASGAERGRLHAERQHVRAARGLDRLRPPGAVEQVGLE